jgi:hypothetical protein
MFSGLYRSHIQIKHAGHIYRSYLQITHTSDFDSALRSFYWVSSSAFDPGAAGMSPDTWAAKFVILGHWFFMVIMTAIYTAAVGPYMLSAYHVAYLRWSFAYFCLI